MRVRGPRSFLLISAATVLLGLTLVTGLRAAAGRGGPAARAGAGRAHATVLDAAHGAAPRGLSARRPTTARAPLGSTCEVAAGSSCSDDPCRIYATAAAPAVLDQGGVIKVHGRLFGVAGQTRCAGPVQPRSILVSVIQAG
jgi:hypothetical protein